MTSKFSSLGSLEQILFVRESLLQLPELNLRVFMFITGFLCKITDYKEYNKMNSYNMSVVFSPCFFRPEQYSKEELEK